MQSATEIDRRIAAFLGKPFRKPTHGSCCTCQTCGHYYDECQCGYTEDMSEAWEVVEHMVGNGYCPALIYDDNGHWAMVTDGTQNVPMGPDPQDICTSFWVEAKDWYDTPMLAICMAALDGL